MKHYITPDNQTWGFDNTQEHLIPKDAVLISDIYTVEQIPFIMLVNGMPVFNQEKYDSDIKKEQDKKNAETNAKASALAKLSALGLTADEVKALLG